MKLLEDNHGEMPEKEARDLAAEKTGLTEYEVYQWLYKKILRMKEDYKNKNGISKGQTKIFIVKLQDGEAKPQPIFKLERCPKSQCHDSSTGKPGVQSLAIFARSS